jgi:hypothetical protein
MISGAAVARKLLAARVASTDVRGALLLEPGTRLGSMKCFEDVGWKARNPIIDTHRTGGPESEDFTSYGADAFPTLVGCEIN